ILDIAWNNGYSLFQLKAKNSKGEIGWLQLDDVKFNLSNYFYWTDPHKKYKWSKKTWNAIHNQQVLIGMNPTQVMLSWGKPDDINRTVGSWGVHEQWVYRYGDFEANYLYFRNGKLTSWQD
ncbi:MAG: hypothetical protein ACYC4E_00310, partial [Carboxydocellales bacterium]